MKLIRRILESIMYLSMVFFFLSNGKVASAVDKPNRDVIQTLSDLGSFDILTNVILRGDRVATFKSAENPVTLFAPSDRAFQALPKGRLDQLWMNNVELRNTLDYHITGGRIELASLTGTRILVSENGMLLHIHNENGNLYVNDARVIELIPASSGNIYVINKVLLP